MKAYLFEYINENEFKKLERSLKKYNMLAYKKMYFEYYPKIKKGEFLGELINENEEYLEYSMKLPTDALFAKVHGNLRLVYKVSKIKNVIKLDRLEPVKILSEGHRSELVSYKGVMISKDEEQKDKFKVQLLNMIQK